MGGGTGVLNSLRVLVSRICGIFTRRRPDEDFRAELDSHLVLLTEENLLRGMTPEEARREAHVRLGGVTQLRETNRELHGLPWMETLAQDIRYGLRMLRKNPGFTTVAVLTLALGIGANTAIFSLIDAVMLKMLPVKNPEQLVLLSWVSQQTPAGEKWLHGDLQLDTSGRVTSHSFSYPAFEEFQRTNHVFSSFFGFDSFASANISAAGQANYAEEELISGDYFSALGVQPVLGRFITPKDESLEAPSVAVISYGLWSRQFGRSPAALGKSIAVNGVPCAVIGVAPHQFFGVTPGRAVDVWVPLVQNPKLLPWETFHFPGESPSFDSPGHWWVEMMGRLKPGVTEDQAQAQLEVLFQQSRSGFDVGAKPQTIPHLQLESAGKGLASLREEFSTPLQILTMFVGIVLLIACANTAALLMARSAERQQEIALRLSLGASRARLARQLLTESVLLAGMGGVAGVLFAHWAIPALVLLMSSGGQPLSLSVPLDAKVLAFTAAVSILTGILFGLAPALRSFRLDLNPALKPGVSGAPARGKGTRGGLAKSLVVIQVALALMLSIGAGLLVRSLNELEGQSLGFDQNHLLLFHISPQLNGYQDERLVSFYTRLRARLQALPGVKSVSMSFLTPVSDFANDPPISVEGYESSPWKSMKADWDNVGPSFFETMGIPLMMGRGIESRDTADSPRVAVVNEAFVHEAFGGRNPIGRRVRFGFSADQPLRLPVRSPYDKPEYEIVGVVRNARLTSVWRAPFPAVYTPYAQMPKILAGLHFELRTEGDPLAFVPTVHRAVHDIDPDVPISDARTQTQQIAATLIQERLLGRLSSFFGGLAILLAGVGLYGLMAYAVAQRTREIGIRMAPGSQRSDALRLVVGQGLKLTLVGVMIGIAGGLALTRLLASLLYGVKPTDPATFFAVSAILAVVALVACYIPARRAVRVDPMVALRYE